ncbi:MAG: Aerobic respiration control sensor protein ArcB [Gemmatimonadetes bacterium]|nr:Aerobic respiration control sensor protein ArcB [Gemmatimonadota bacterium]
MLSANKGTADAIDLNLDRRHTETLLKTGALQSAIFNSANFSSIATDARGVIQIFNVGAERMLGYTAADVMNKITPADISDPQEVISRAKALSVELGTPITPGFEALVFKASRGIEDIYELTYIRKDGSRFPAVVSVTALRDAKDAIIGYLLIGTDNTARKLAEEALRENYALLRTIHLHSIVSVTDRAGRIVDANDGFCKISGYSREELLGQTHRIVNSGVQARAFWTEMWRNIAAGLPWRGEICNRTKQGALYWVDSIIAPFMGEDGRTKRYISVRTDITARKQAEEALLKAGALQSAIFNSANFSSIATDAKGVIQIFNVGAERMLGYTAAEVMNKITPADISDPQEVIARAKALTVELGTPITPGFEALVFKASRGIEDIYELTYVRKDGSRFPAVVSVTALRDAQNAIIGYLLIGTDNTARKRAEEDRKRFFELSQDVLCTLGFDGYFKDLNPAWEKTLGYTKAELLATPFIEFIHPDDRHLTLAHAEMVSEGKALLAFENRYRCKDGSYRWLQWSVTPVVEDRVMYGVARDVTEQKQEEAALLKAGALQSAIFNSANFSSIATDAKGVIQIFNVGAERMLGYTAAEVMNKITPADISDPQEVIARAKALTVELGTPITPGFEALVFKASRGIEDIYELTYIRKDGSRFPAVVSVTALRDAQNAIIGYLLIGTDNTARKLVEAEQQKLDQRLRDQQFYTRSLIESNIDALMTTDPSGIITDVNKQMEALTGCTRDELIGAPFKNYFTDPERAEAGIKLVLSRKKVSNYELTACARDGKRTDVSYNATTFYDRDRKLQGVFAAARDVTERKRFEQTLQEKNAEMENANLAKDRFLASMSHELRTPLNAIIGFTGTLLMKLPGPLTIDQDKQLRTVQTSGRHLLSLINDLLDLAKIESGKVELNPEPVVCQSVLEEVRTALQPLAEAKNLLFEVTHPEADRTIRTDRRAFTQILLNLVNNAIKFTETGRVLLDLDHQGQNGSSSIVVRVADTGTGIRLEDQTRLFQAFEQVTAGGRRQEGTGLGLHLSQKLANLLGGNIEFESEYGKGSTFTLTLKEH